MPGWWHLSLEAESWAQGATGRHTCIHCKIKSDGASVVITSTSWALLLVRGGQPKVETQEGSPYKHKIYKSSPYKSPLIKKESPYTVISPYKLAFPGSLEGRILISKKRKKPSLCFGFVGLFQQYRGIPLGSRIIPGRALGTVRSARG